MSNDVSDDKIDDNAIVASTGNVINDSLNWLYDRVIEDSFLGLEGAEALAGNYSSNSQCLCAAIDSLINWQTLNAGTIGFVAGVGGLMALPVTLPANIASVTYLQLRMIAAIAHLCGHDIRSERVRILIYACLVGGAAEDLLKEAGVAIGSKFAQQAIRNIPGAVLKSINKAVGFRLVAKAGAATPINVAKMVPIVGGLVSAGFDAAYIRGIGAAAKSVFAPGCDGVPEKCRMA